MKKEIIKNLTADFESYSNKTENKIEFWFARDLQHLLGYTEWRNFTKAINKARTACETSGHQIPDHFVEVNKTIDMPKDATKDIKTGQQISWEHIRNNKGVRKLLLERGIKPEELPADEDAKKLERRVKSEDKKFLKDPKKLQKSGKDATELENQIDEMVYKLYELTYEEVKIVDSAFALLKEEYENFKLK